MFESSLSSTALFDLDESLAGDRLRHVTWPWLLLKDIGALILDLGPQLPRDEYEQINEQMWIARDCHIAPTASLKGPLIIGHETDVRHGAFIRGNALVGNQAVVGHATELKNSILFNQVQVPHYNYVGDAILGFKAHLGAGAITSNVKGDRSLVVLRVGENRIETGLKKMGALVGDNVEVGCNAVLNPGTIVGRGTQIYPLTFVRGIIPANSILKQNGDLVTKKNRPS